MTQEVFPEIQAATEALEKQIALTETEIDQMKETITSKKQLVKGWRKAIAAVNPKPVGQEENGDRELNPDRPCASIESDGTRPIPLPSFLPP